MKKMNFLLLSFSCLLLLNCRKNKEEPKLPPETTTGAMTFGCKVNGKVFVPRDGRGKPGLFVQYVYLGEGPGGGWYLNIPATNWRSSELESMYIRTDSLLIIEGKTYEFELDSYFNPVKGTFSAGYATSGGGGYLKTTDDIGTISIHKFDGANRIIAATFSFTATSPSTGEKIEVTEGRFDIRY